MNPDDDEDEDKDKAKHIDIPESPLDSPLDSPDSLPPDPDPESPVKSRIHNNPLAGSYPDSPPDSPNSLPPDPDPEPDSPNGSSTHDNPLADDVEEGERRGRSTSMRKGMWKSMEQDSAQDQRDETRSVNSEASSTSWSSVHNNPLTLDDEYNRGLSRNTSMRREMWKSIPSSPATSLPPPLTRRRSSRRISFSLPWRIRNLHYVAAGGILVLSTVVFFITQMNREDEYHTCLIPT